MADEETNPDRPPHTWVASKIGFSVAGVSLLRSGQRLPSFPTMLLIEREFNWPLAEQAEARTASTYAAKFERALERAYKARDDAG